MKGQGAKRRTTQLAGVFEHRAKIDSGGGGFGDHFAGTGIAQGDPGAGAAAPDSTHITLQVHHDPREVQVGGRYLPLKWGRRFSLNAATPSAKSAERPSSRCMSRSRSNCWRASAARCANGGLGGGEAPSGRAGEMLGERIDGGGRFRILDAAPDHAPGGGLFGGQFVAEQGQAQRPRVADQARQAPCPAAVGNQSELAKGLNEAGGTRRDDQIAGQRDIGARSCRNAIDRRDHGHGQGMQCEHQRIVVLVHGSPEIEADRAPRCAIREILAGAESAAGTGEHQHAGAAARIARASACLHLAVHLDVEAVELVGPIQRQPGDAIVER